MTRSGITSSLSSPAQGEIVNPAPLQGHCGMAVSLEPGLGLVSLMLALMLLLSPGPVQAQSSQGLFWQCATNGGQPQYCPVNNTYPLPVTDAVTGAGSSTYRSVALTSTALAVKTSAGTVSFLHVANLESMAVTCYVHLYDVAAASVTVGTTVPKWSMVLGAGTIQTVPFTVPLVFGTAITVAATTTAGGSTACNPILTLTEIAYK